MSATTVGHLLHDLGYRLQALQKTPEGTAHPYRNAQFEHIKRHRHRFCRGNNR